jgi:hypothetical protein
MDFRNFLPLARQPKNEEASKNTITLDSKKETGKLLRVASLALGLESGALSLTKTSKYEPPPHDFERIKNAIDTDSYIKSAFSKYRELFWKESWDIVGENEEAVNYLWQRIDYFEEVMQVPFQKFLGDVFDQYIRYANVFVAKSRNDLNPLFPSDLVAPEGKYPIVGYYVLPTEYIEIYRDKHNKPKRYRQSIDNTAGMFGKVIREPSWSSDEVIHMYYDKSPGHAFGVPFVVTALDDTSSLRQIEEDILNLIHRELFPIYKFTIGDDNQPAEPDEIEKAMNEIQGMRTESALVMPHRYNVEVIGVGDKSLDANGYLGHFRERVATGLGVFPHHLGMGAPGNRSVTDRLDIMLYDRVKYFQRDFAELVRFFFFNEWLREGGYDPMVHPRLSGVSDRCYFKFREIDVDTQIKKESHVLTKVAGNIETVPEGRLEIGMSPDMEDSETMNALQVRLQPTITTLPGKKTATGGTSEPKLVDTTPQAASKGTQSTGGVANMKNLKKGSGNIVRPTNQYGTRTSPNVRHDDSLDRWLNECIDLIEEKNDDAA